MRNIPGLLLLAILCVFTSRVAAADDTSPTDFFPVGSRIINNLGALPEYICWRTNTAWLFDQLWRIGVLGTDPFGERLEKLVSECKSANIKLEIWHAAGLSNPPPCDIIFIVGKDTGEINKL